MNRLEIGAAAGLGFYLWYTMRNHQDAPMIPVTTGTQVRQTPQALPWQNIPVQLDQQGSQIYGNVGLQPGEVTASSDTSNPSAPILYAGDGANLDNHPVVMTPTTQPTPKPPTTWNPPAYIKGNQSVRELVALYKAFGPNSGYAKYLASAPKSGLVNGSLTETINAYESGGMYAWNDYSNAHASPRDFGWTWTGSTWVPPKGANTFGTYWTGTYFGSK